MSKTVNRSLAVVLATAGGLTAQRLWKLHEQRNPAAQGKDTAGSLRWNVVTIQAPHELSVDAELPDPLRRLSSKVEVRFRPAPGDRGVELAARPREGFEDEGLRREIREALRDSKQLIETGEILRILPRPEGARPATPTGAIVDLAERIGKKGGVL
ncbi:hypothetical protein [Herbiconiux sp. L3-i23]|uniref:hypothetical protein n=1 Tax=Herbiconiux sp. L3-i23 TaxID=2905871 RepID=UPI0020679C7A|nr:hypothetical protein [Herbiconiux sp. L3-i23]BDI23093.1 hypothetical protein L3i23_18690 [Herbiconiux sp. L3-i23]